MQKRNNKNKNLISMIIGILLIIIGLFGSAITIPAKEPIIIAPILLLIIGAILALLGGLRKW